MQIFYPLFMKEIERLKSYYLFNNKELCQMINAKHVTRITQVQH